VLQSIGDDCDYESAASRLHIPAGQAYLKATGLIATGLPADGGDTFPPDEHLQRPGALKGSTQHLVHKRPEAADPTRKPEVHDWIRRRVAADPQITEAARTRDAEPGEPVDPQDTDVRFVLTRQHDKVTALMEQLKAIPGASKGGDELVEHAMEQEQEGKESLVALGRADSSGEQFDKLAEELETRLRKHVAFEDRVLLSLPEVMSDDDRRELGNKILRAEKHAPTRPHPHAPKKPGGAVKAAAASVVPRDRARGAFGSRPAERVGRASSETEEDK